MVFRADQVIHSSQSYIKAVDTVHIGIRDFVSSEPLTCTANSKARLPYSYLCHTRTCSANIPKIFWISPLSLSFIRSWLLPPLSQSGYNHCGSATAKIWGRWLGLYLPLLLNLGTCRSRMSTSATQYIRFFSALRIHPTLQSRPRMHLLSAKLS